MRVAVLITGQLRDYKINALNQIKHLIEPNSADVFVYACTKNTLHTCGENIVQNYKITTERDPEDLRGEIKTIYGKYLKQSKINETEDLDDAGFGTIGYFRKRMQNQMDNIREGFNMATAYSKKNSFEYDVVVRCRPDNSIFLHRVDLSKFPIEENEVYATQYYTGHRDPWFFSFSRPKTFQKYCSLKYLDGVDDARTDNDFLCPETAMEHYLHYEQKIKLKYVLDMCLTFTEYDKTRPIRDFPYRDKTAHLIDHNGNFVDQVEPV